MEYKNERFTLNRVCQFHSREVEADFMEYDKTASLNTIRLLMLTLGSVFFLFVFSDYFFYRENPAFVLAVGLRGLGLVITIVASILIGRFKRYQHSLIMLTVTQLLVFSTYLLNMYVLQSDQAYLQFMTVVLYILAVFIIPNVWKNCFIAACVVLLGYLVFRANFVISTEAPSLAIRGIYLCICLFCCAILIFGREKSRRKQFAAERLLEYMSITDSLTGINNRGRFEYVLGTWIKNMRHNPISLLVFDIDDFKKVNDRYGHTVGDQVLITTTEIISAHIRSEDIFARWGGEEFVVLFSCTGLEKAVELAERLRRMVEINPCAEEKKVTISVGAAEYRKGETITEFVHRADEKMYEAKRAGKNQVMA